MHAYTFRITREILPTHKIQQFVDNHKKITKFLLYKEVIPKTHYHGYLTSSYKSKNSILNNIVKSLIQDINNIQHKGNGLYAVQPNPHKKHPDIPTAPQNYVCKQQHRVYTKNYTEEELQQFEQDGKKYENIKKTKSSFRNQIYNKILSLDPKPKELTLPKTIIKIVLELCIEMNKTPPSTHVIQGYIRYIHLQLYPKGFTNSYIDAITQSYRHQYHINYYRLLPNWKDDPHIHHDPLEPHNL